MILLGSTHSNANTNRDEPCTVANELVFVAEEEDCTTLPVGLDKWLKIVANQN